MRCTNDSTERHKQAVAAAALGAHKQADAAAPPNARMIAAALSGPETHVQRNDLAVDATCSHCRCGCNCHVSRGASNVERPVLTLQPAERPKTRRSRRGWTRSPAECPSATAGLPPHHSGRPAAPRSPRRGGSSPRLRWHWPARPLQSRPRTCATHTIMQAAAHISEPAGCAQAVALVQAVDALEEKVRGDWQRRLDITRRSEMLVHCHQVLRVSTHALSKARSPQHLRHRLTRQHVVRHACVCAMRYACM
jgi:hypothetical protein